MSLSVNYSVIASLYLCFFSLFSMDLIESSHLFPHITICPQAQTLINMHAAKQWGGQKKDQLKLLRRLDVGCAAERIFPDYRLTADDYQKAANDPVVLQAWIACLPPDMRDIQVKRFFSEMTFTNNVNTLGLLDSLGLCADKFGPEFLARLIRRAKNSNYQDLVAYLNRLIK